MRHEYPIPPGLLRRRRGAETEITRQRQEAAGMIRAFVLMNNLDDEAKSISADTERGVIVWDDGKEDPENGKSTAAPEGSVED